MHRVDIQIAHGPERRWESELKDSFRTARDLFAEGFIQENEIPAFDSLLRKYRFLLPRYYAGLIDKADPKCPIRLQAIPSLLEREKDDRDSSDPLNDLAYQPSPRVTHRYPNRALFHLTPNCSMYCRYCFRKSLLNELSDELFEGGFEEALTYFSTHPEIEEVIFSGGDPFLVSDLTLARLLSRLAEMPHVQRVRFHTRVPVTFPARITRALIAALTSTRFTPIIVSHFNHPKELTDEARAGVSALRVDGLAMLNQSVLLRGVNDSASVLAKLYRELFSWGVSPYYLHHPDQAAGTRHFSVAPEEGLLIHQALRELSPGYLVPRYVIDTGDQLGKRDVVEWWASRL